MYKCVRLLFQKMQESVYVYKYGGVCES